MATIPSTLQLVDAARGYEAAPGVVIDLKVQGPESAPPLLVLHGVEGCDANREFIDELAKDRRVFVPSHPGFDLSPWSQGITAVEDLAYLYLSFLERQNLSGVHLVGLQFGAWIAAEIAIRDQSRLSRISFVGPVGIKHGRRTERHIMDVFAEERTTVEAGYLADSERRYSGRLATAPREEVQILSRNEEALATYAWEPYMHNPRLRKWLHRITIPAQVIRGEEDTITSSEYAQAFYAELSDAQLAKVPLAAHAAQIDQPRNVAGIIRN